MLTVDVSFQIENWIDEIGEPFLRDHLDTGSSLEETEKYCNDFTTFLDEVNSLEIQFLYAFSAHGSLYMTSILQYWLYNSF